MDEKAQGRTIDTRESTHSDIGKVVVAESSVLRRLKSISIPIVAYTCLLTWGVWHGFPGLKVVGDEGLYVGGVLKSLQAMSIMPIDMAYSYTVSFYVNYLLFIPFVAVLYAIFHGSIPAVIDFLTTHVWVAYFIPRLVSIIASVVTFALFLDLAKRFGKTVREACVVGVLVGANPLFLMISHTGKMWSLSLLLWFLSFYCFVRAIDEHRSETSERPPVYTYFAFWSLVCAGFAVANFPMNIIVGFVGLALLFGVYKKQIPFRPVFWGGICGAFVFLVLCMLNYDGWTTQISALTPTEKPYAGVVRYFMYGGLFIIPLHALYAVWCATGAGMERVQKHALYLVVVSIVGYSALIFARAPWVGDNFGYYWRYFYYLIFLIGLAFLCVRMRRTYIAYSLAVLCMLCGIRLSYLLAIPTTYNLAATYIQEHAGTTLIVSDVDKLDLKKNQEASLATRDDRCGTPCLLARRGDYTGHDALLVLDGASEADAASALQQKHETYYLVSTKNTGKGELVFAIENGLPGDVYLEVDYRLGLYDKQFFTADRIGTDIFIEKVGK